jgi:hypothetical protein
MSQQLSVEMYGIYLRCDNCNATLGGETFDPPLDRWDEQKLRDEARRQGWTGLLTRESAHDRCPACSPVQLLTHYL